MEMKKEEINKILEDWDYSRNAPAHPEKPLSFEEIEKEAELAANIFLFDHNEYNKFTMGFKHGAKWASQQSCPPVGEQGGWVKVEDRLPEESCLVLIWIKNGYNPIMAHYSNQLKKFHSDHIHITHWQPLPKKP